MKEIINSPYGGRTEPKLNYRNERGYMELLWDIIHFGSDTPDRTGVGRRKLFAVTQRYDLRDGFPYPTARNTPMRIAFEEFWAFLNGRCDIHTYLNEKSISIWEGNTTRSFLDNRGLGHLPVGHGGKAYGFQYRNFNGEYDENFMPTGGIDQIKNVYEGLLNDPFGSRHVVTIWNPNQEKEMALPPCWWNHQFVVTLNDKGEKVLNIQVTGRSNDTIFGTPFNVSEFSLWLAVMAKATNMIAGELVPMQVDAHIYGKLDDLNKPDHENHISSQMKYAIETLQREISEEPVQLTINKELNSLEDILSLQFSDFEFSPVKVNKTPYEAKHPTMAV